MTVGETLGATVTPGGTRFGVWSSVAERIELCLFDGDLRETDRLDLTPADDHVWRAVVGGAGVGTRYGYRVHGPGAPAAGHACDPAKLLVDPAARRIVGELSWVPELTAPGVDSAPFVPRSVVVADAVPVPASSRPRTPWDRTVVYEAHVGHLTARHPLVGRAQQGRYAGLAAPPVVDHLLRLGVSAVELLPVQTFVSEAELSVRGRANVWGYNPLAWSAPEAGYASAGGDPVAELRSAVDGLHRAGIEVWLDVVFNHTCEGALGTGPILSWRGFDNAAMYRLLPGPHGLIDDDVTGCGNAVDTRSPVVRRLIVESLVRWVEQFGIDGFRFDLAAELIRGDDGPTPDSPFLAAIAAEPALADVKLVAEPWDAGLGGYALGAFPEPWREWNDRFRDDTRDLWRGRGNWSTASSRLTGSDELLRRGPVGINAVSTHDGFTLADLVSYDHPTDRGHGQRSWGGGQEGPTVDPAVVVARRRRQRCLLGTVACSQGTPMVLSGDEIGRSQGGRADGYTLPAEEWGVSWLQADWDLNAWLARALALRDAHPVLRRETWVAQGDPRITWLDQSGVAVADDRWGTGEVSVLQVVLDGSDLGDGRVLLVLDPGGSATDVVLPAGVWRVELDASEERPPRPADRRVVSGRLGIEGPAFVILVDVSSA